MTFDTSILDLAAKVTGPGIADLSSGSKLGNLPKFTDPPTPKLGDEFGKPKSRRRGRGGRGKPPAGTGITDDSLLAGLDDSVAAAVRDAQIKNTLFTGASLPDELPPERLRG